MILKYQSGRILFFLVLIKVRLHFLVSKKNKLKRETGIPYFKKKAQYRKTPSFPIKKMS